MNQNSASNNQDFTNEIEQGGVKDVPNSKASFFSRKVVIALALTVVSLVLGGVIYSQMASSTNKETKSTNKNEASLVSKKSIENGSAQQPQKELERIFFAAPVLESNGKITHRVASILENGIDLQFYDETNTGNSLIPPVANKKYGKICFHSANESSPSNAMIIDLNGTEFVPLTDKISVFPSFNPEGDKIVAVEFEPPSDESPNIRTSIILIESESKAVLLRKRMDNPIMLPQFSHNSEYIIYGEFGCENQAIYKRKLTKTGDSYDLGDPQLVCNVAAGKIVIFLVSPTQDKLLKIEMSESKTDFKINLDIIDINDGTASPIEVASLIENDKLFPITWSSENNIVYLYKMNDNTNVNSLIKLNIETGDSVEIYTFTILQKEPKSDSVEEFSQEQLDANRVNADIISQDGGKDRIFFYNEKEIMSVLEDGTKLCHHGKVREGDEVIETISDKETKKLIFKVKEKNRYSYRVFIQDWAASELTETPLFEDLDVDQAIIIPNSGNIAFSPDKQKYYGNLLIPNNNGNSYVNLIPTDLRLNISIRPQLSHDGKSIICYSDMNPRAFYEVPLDGKSSPKMIYAPDISLDSFLVSPIDKRIFAKNGLNTFYLIEPKEEGESIFKRFESDDIDRDLSYFRLISWSSNGRFIYMDKTDCSGHTLIKLEIETGKITTIYEIEKGD